MKKVRWIIQKNDLAENDLRQLQEACKELGLEYHDTLVIPFIRTLPEFPIDDDHENIYYGGTTFMNNVYEHLNKPLGLFYDEEEFVMENYLEQWKDHMFNSESTILKLSELENFKSEPDVNWFVRPNGDGKEFDGQVVLFKDLNPMFERMVLNDDTNRITPDFKILLNPAYNIHKEWRNYIVDGKIVSSSLYRKNFKLNKSSTDIPTDMIEFVEKRISEYKPHDNFAIDIASTHDGTYFVLECGCINSVGFYASDIKNYVKTVSEYISKKI